MRTSDIAFALIEQVQKAIPYGGNERDVRTIISRPLWTNWLVLNNLPIDSEPTEWIGLHSIRVYGSETIVVDSLKMFSYSTAIK